jgi:hypothetical protein
MALRTLVVLPSLRRRSLRGARLGRPALLPSLGWSFGL